MNVVHGVVVQMRLNRILQESGLGRRLDDPPKGVSNPVLDIIVNPVGYEGCLEGCQVEFEIEDVAWERNGDHEGIEVEVIVDDVNVVVIDVLNPRGMDGD